MLKFVEDILQEHKNEVDNLQESPLVKYLNLKMGAINEDSKTRRNYGNIYAIYSLTKSYDSEHKNNIESYLTFDGYNFQKILDFVKTLYGATKIQNHALNNRLNAEFMNKFSINKELIKITNSKYKINEYFIFYNNVDISHIIIKIIDKYIELLYIKDTNILNELNLMVTEVNNYDKYLLDMDKVSHYPITFVVKTNNENIFEEFINHIDNKNIDDFTKNNYKNSIGGMITINNLKEYLTDFYDIVINNTFNEIIFQYKLEFNIL